MSAFETYTASRWTDSFMDRLMRQGASRKYAEPFAIASAVAQEDSPFDKVTGQNLAEFHRRRIPVDYALTAVGRGVSPAVVVQFWSSGVPLEYVTSGAT